MRNNSNKSSKLFRMNNYYHFNNLNNLNLNLNNNNNNNNNNLIKINSNKWKK